MSRSSLNRASLNPQEHDVYILFPAIAAIAVPLNYPLTDCRSPRPPQLHLLCANRRNRRSLPVWHRSLRVRDGVCTRPGLDEHSVLHQRTQAHRYLQHHDTEGKAVKR